MVLQGVAVNEELDNTVRYHFETKYAGAAGRCKLVTGVTETLKHIQETHIQVLQTVPAESVFAAHAQHLRAALVPLDVGAAHGTLLDRQVRTAVANDPAQTRTRAGKRTRVTLNLGSYVQTHAGLIILWAEERSLFSS